MDHWFIRSLKAKYGTKVVQMMVNAVNNDKPFSTISIIEAIKMLILTWVDVSTMRVQNCFKNNHFLHLMTMWL